MKKGILCRLGWLFGLIMAFAGPAIAQESTSAPSTASVDQEKQEQEAKEAKEKAKKDAQERAERSRAIRDHMFSDIRNSAAFSVGILENYDSNIFYSSNAEPQSDTYTLLYPRFVANLQREHGLFTADYLGGYRLYSHLTELNKSEHHGTFQFHYDLSRRTALNVSDSISYLPLDSLSFLQQASFTSNQPGVPPQLVFFKAQNTLSNFFNLEVSYKLSEPTSVQFFGGYNLTRYQGDTSNNSEGFLVGFQLAHRPTPRLTINTRYEFADFTFNNQFGSSKVNRLTVGFNYAIRPSVSIFGSVGPELATIPGISRVELYFRGGATKTLEATQLAVEYQQSTHYDQGLATGLFSRTVFGSLSHRFNEKLSLGLNAGYGASHYLVSGASDINSFQGGPKMEYALRPDLTFVVSYTYVKQTADQAVLNTPRFSRHFFSIGFEYRIPRLLRQ